MLGEMGLEGQKTSWIEVATLPLIFHDFSQALHLQEGKYPFWSQPGLSNACQFSLLFPN